MKADAKTQQQPANPHCIATFNHPSPKPTSAQFVTTSALSRGQYDAWNQIADAKAEHVVQL
jgi:hypothetical protein